MVKIVLAPGNGCGDLSDCMWYPSVMERLRSDKVETKLENFPDPLYARETQWIPFLKDTLGADESTVVIGHSSGAAAAMRLAETTKLRGMVLVSAYKSDLGDSLERVRSSLSMSRCNTVVAKSWILCMSSVSLLHRPAAISAGLGNGRTSSRTAVSSSSFTQRMITWYHSRRQRRSTTPWGQSSMPWRTWGTFRKTSFRSWFRPSKRSWPLAIDNIQRSPSLLSPPFLFPLPPI